MKRKNRTSYIPKGAVRYPDGSWYYKYTEEERKEFKPLPIGNMFGLPIGYGELVCTAD
jgi:hypothetical protein